IRINYSIHNKLKLLGYTGEYININNNYSDIKKKYLKTSPHKNTNNEQVHKKNGNNLADGTLDNANNNGEQQQLMYKEIVRDISRSRIDNLKGTLLEFQRLFNRILNGHIGRLDNEKYEKYVETENKPI